jgi:4'-phosphopantetheinyl transferase
VDLENSSVIKLELLDAQYSRELDVSIIPQNQITEINKYRNYEDRYKRLLARVCLYQRLKSEYKVSNFELKYNQYMKPFLSAYPNISFSFSYTSTYVLVAYSSTHTIGVDIESLDANLDIDSIAREIMHEDELSSFNELTDIHSKTIFFYQVFSAKEAIIKAIGMGLYFDIKKINFLEQDVSQGKRYVYQGKTYYYKSELILDNQLVLSQCSYSKL